MAKANGFVIFSLSFKHIVMANYNTSKNNQWILNWFRIKAITTWDKESIIILEICQVRRGITLPLILTIFYLL